MNIALVGLYRAHFGAVRHAPELYGIVLAARSQEFPAGGEGQGQHPVGMALQSFDQSVFVHVTPVNSRQYVIYII